MTSELPAALPTTHYVGFWARVVASIVDSILLVLLLIPFSFFLIGSDRRAQGAGLGDFVINTVLPAMVVILFWARRQATPGKMLFHARIVDAETGANPEPWQWVVRYLGYIVSTIFLGLGFLWVAFDRRKQGWHDKLARTVVVADR